MSRVQFVALAAALGLFVSAPLVMAEDASPSAQTVAKHKRKKGGKKHGKKKKDAAPAAEPMGAGAPPAGEAPPPAGM